MEPTTEASKIYLTGSCVCKTIRYRLTALPLYTHCCHCTSCQRETGTAFAVNSLIESVNLETLSSTAPVPHRVPSNSGEGHTIFRCPSCYTPVWSLYGDGPLPISFVCAGSLDEPGAAKPDIHIFTRSKAAWVVLPEGVPAVEVYYKNKDYWPAESLARLNKLKEAARMDTS